MKAVKKSEDLLNEGGSAPGGVVAFPAAAHQWSNSNTAAYNNYPNIDPISAAKMMHYGLADEAPDVANNSVPIHPGLAPGQFRTARDANYNAPDGEVPTSFKPFNDPTANDGRLISGGSVVGGGHRGESPEVLKNPRGAYRP